MIVQIKGHSSGIISSMRSIQNFARAFEREFSAYAAVVFYPSGHEKKKTSTGEKEQKWGKGGEGRVGEGRGTRGRIELPKLRGKS